MRKRGAYFGIALILLLIAVTLPTAWYDSIPRQPGSPPPFRGVTLLRLTFLFEALVFGALAARDWSFASGSGSVSQSKPEAADDLSSATAMAALAAITALAVVLRSISLGSDLWIDEITTIVDYRDMPSLQVIGSYLRSNNHLLNTLLMKSAIAVFGEHEWSARLPAMLFGVGTIPVMYWVARLAMSRLASLGAALLLAMSYHHIFFSQNARGYTAYLFFALLSTGALARGLQRDELRQWVLYALSVVLGFASLITMGFVFAAQILTGVIAVLLTRRKKLPIGPVVQRLVAVYAIAGFLSFQLYAASLPEAYVVITSLYSVHGTTYSAFSTDFLHDAFRGLSAGFGGGAAALVFLVLGALGYASLVAASWPVAATLALT
jgi:mannosyltransferase